MKQYILLKVGFLCAVVSFFCQITSAIACLPINVLQEQYRNHLNVKPFAWDGSVEGHQSGRGHSSRNGYYLLGFKYHTWEILPDEKPILDVFSSADAKNKVIEGLPTLSGEMFIGFAPVEGSRLGHSSGKMMRCEYKMNIYGEVHTITAEGWLKG